MRAEDSEEEGGDEQFDGLDGVRTARRLGASLCCAARPGGAGGISKLGKTSLGTGPRSGRGPARGKGTPQGKKKRNEKGGKCVDRGSRAGPWQGAGWHRPTRIAAVTATARAACALTPAAFLAATQKASVTGSARHGLSSQLSPERCSVLVVLTFR